MNWSGEGAARARVANLEKMAQRLEWLNAKRMGFAEPLKDGASTVTLGASPSFSARFKSN